MTNHEAAVRAAANHLAAAISAARAAGYVVTWPAVFRDLPNILVSPSASAIEAEAAAAPDAAGEPASEAPVAVPRRRR